MCAAFLQLYATPACKEARRKAGVSYYMVCCFVLYKGNTLKIFVQYKRKFALKPISCLYYYFPSSSRITFLIFGAVRPKISSSSFAGPE